MENDVNESKRQQFLAGAACCSVSLLTMLLVGFAPRAAAEDTAGTTIYRSVGADGVVSFSDVAHPAAVPVEVIPPPPSGREEQERAAELFDQQLRILEILESSRQAREADALAQERLDLDYVRTEAALERTRALEEQNYDNDNGYYPYFYPYFYPQRPCPPFGPRPPHGGRPGMPPPIEQPTQHVKLP